VFVVCPNNSKKEEDTYMADEQNEHQARELFFAFFLHEAENLHNRVDWFLIFHAILLEAFFAARYGFQQLIVGLLGCIVAYVWLVAGIRQLWNLQHMVQSVSDEEVMGSETAYLFRKLLIETRRVNQPSWMRWASATPAFSAILPLAILIAWIILIAAEGSRTKFVLGVIGLLALSSLLVAQHTKLAACLTQSGRASAPS
jgi:hypothetical protein